MGQTILSALNQRTNTGLCLESGTIIIKPAFTVSRDNRTGSVVLGGGYCSPGGIAAGVGRVLLAAPVILRDLGEVGHAETSQLLRDGTLSLRRANIRILKQTSHADLDTTALRSHTRQHACG